MNFKNKLSFYNPIATIIGLVCITVSSIIFQGCKKLDNDLLDNNLLDNNLLDNNIINSSELEEYIIAGADFQHSLAVFNSRMNKIDFSKLEVTYDAKGNKVVHLSPDLVGNIRIEEKVHMFNVKKEALLKKFPNFVSFSKVYAKKYFQNSMKNSTVVIGAFLKLGINISGPRLKSGGEESWYGDENMVYLESYLYNWVNSPDYVEVLVLFYADGTFGTCQVPGATDHSIDYNLIYDPNTAEYYYPNGGSSSALVSVGHTHQYSSTPSEKDQTAALAAPGVPHFIYYDWTCYYY
jgi:hypothetical protein